jgi:hypothetical protein
VKRQLRRQATLPCTVRASCAEAPACIESSVTPPSRCPWRRLVLLVESPWLCRRRRQMRPPVAVLSRKAARRVQVLRPTHRSGRRFSPGPRWPRRPRYIHRGPAQQCTACAVRDRTPRAARRSHVPASPPLMRRQLHGLHQASDSRVCESIRVRPPRCREPCAIEKSTRWSLSPPRPSRWSNVTPLVSTWTWPASPTAPAAVCEPVNLTFCAWCRRGPAGRVSTISTGPCARWRARSSGRNRTRRLRRSLSVWLPSSP